MKKSKIVLRFLRLLVFAVLLLIPTVSLNAGEGQAIEQKKVYVVMSESAYAYHFDRKCKGLKNATHTIKEVSEEKAKEMGRKPCKICCPKSSQENN